MKLCQGRCLGLKDRCLTRKAGTSPGIENVTPFPLNYYNSAIKGLSGKDMEKGVTLLYKYSKANKHQQQQQQQTEPENPLNVLLAL